MYALLPSLCQRLDGNLTLQGGWLYCSDHHVAIGMPEGGFLESAISLPSRVWTTSRAYDRAKPLEGVSC